MKILIAVASKHGSTREIGEAIAEELRKCGLHADVQDAKRVETTDGYDAVILGSAVYAGHWMGDATYFAESMYAELVGKPVWLFSSGPLGAPEAQPQSDPNKLAESMSHVRVRDHKVFAGKLDVSALGLGERIVAKVVSVPEGDYRDWEAIRNWAHEIEASLRVPTLTLPS